MLNNQMVYVVTFEADMVVPVLEAPIYNMNSFSVLSAPFNTFNVYVIYIYVYWLVVSNIWIILHFIYGNVIIPTGELIFSEGQVYHQPSDYLTLPWKPWPLEIDGLPLKNGRSFHGSVSLPEAIYI